MKTYEYKGYTVQGRPARGLIEANGVKDARDRLAAQHILAERIAATGHQAGFSTERRAVVYRELGALLGAGIPLVDAFEILIESPERGELRSLLAGVRDRVREGAGLADALARAGRQVSPFETSIIEAAERTAMVGPMLDRLADFLDERERLRERVKSALIYPALVLTVGIGVATVMLVVLLPRTRDLLEGSRLTLPWVTRFMIGAGEFALRWGLGLMVAGAAAVVALVSTVRRRPEWRRHLDRRLFQTPILGRGYAWLVNLRFSRTLALLLNGGVGLLDAMVLAGRATGSVWVSALVEREAESVRHGGRISEAVGRIPPLAASLPGWMRTGEAGGGLARLLESASRRYEAQWDRYVSRCLSWLEPLLILLIGSFVLLVTLSILLPVISLTRAVGMH